MLPRADFDSGSTCQDLFRALPDTDSVEQDQMVSEAERTILQPLLVLLGSRIQGPSDYSSHASGGGTCLTTHPPRLEPHVFDDTEPVEAIVALVTSASRPPNL